MAGCRNRQNKRTVRKMRLMKTSKKNSQADCITLATAYRCYLPILTGLGGAQLHSAWLKSGERGIRTPGTFRYATFPRLYLKPLGHLSKGSYSLPTKNVNCQAYKNMIIYKNEASSGKKHYSSFPSDPSLSAAGRNKRTYSSLGRKSLYPAEERGNTRAPDSGGNQSSFGPL